MDDTKTAILVAAERMVRVGGYNGFSFRDIATEIGIKSSSVHYHFPTKEALAVAVAEQYTAAFFEALGEPVRPDHTVEMQLRHYGQVFQESFVASQSACLCGMLSNEIGLLPDALREVVIAFIKANISWLQKAIDGHEHVNLTDDSNAQAVLIYSAFEGAMSVSALMQDGDWLQTVVDTTINGYFSQMAQL